MRMHIEDENFHHVGKSIIGIYLFNLMFFFTLTLKADYMKYSISSDIIIADNTIKNRGC